MKFEKEYTVHVYETGADGKASLWTLFNYMQDIASDHAVRLGFGRDDLMKKNQFWVLSRMYAEIRTVPSWFDRIVIRTWPCGTDKMFAMRSYEISYPDGTKIAAGSSSWLIVDQTSRKIQRPDHSLPRFGEDFRSFETPVRSAEKLPGAHENGNISALFKVRASDLDVNLHTNNANYIRWITDSYDLSFIITHSPVSAEINYLAESVHDDDIMIKTSEEGIPGPAYNHSVIRKVDNRELCRARIVWKEKNDIQSQTNDYLTK